jgi:hypothetical protein
MPRSGATPGLQREREEPLQSCVETARRARRIDRLPELVENLVLAHDDRITSDRDGDRVANRSIVGQDPPPGREQAREG